MCLSIQQLNPLIYMGIDILLCYAAGTVSLF